MQTTNGTRAPRRRTFATALVALGVVLGATGCAGSTGSAAPENVGQAIQPVIEGIAHPAATRVIAAPAATTEPPSAAGGCSMTTEPQSGSVEYAAGLVALLASLFGLRRRGKSEAEVELPSRRRDRLPSMP